MVLLTVPKAPGATPAGLDDGRAVGEGGGAQTWDDIDAVVCVHAGPTLEGVIAQVGQGIGEVTGIGMPCDTGTTGSVHVLSGPSIVLIIVCTGAVLVQKLVAVLSLVKVRTSLVAYVDATMEGAGVISHTVTVWAPLTETVCV